MSSYQLFELPDMMKSCRKWSPTWNLFLWLIIWLWYANLWLVGTQYPFFHDITAPLLHLYFLWLIFSWHIFAAKVIVKCKCIPATEHTKVTIHSFSFALFYQFIYWSIHNTIGTLFPYSLSIVCIVRLLEHTMITHVVKHKQLLYLRWVKIERCEENFNCKLYILVETHTWFAFCFVPVEI